MKINTYKHLKEVFKESGLSLGETILGMQNNFLSRAYSVYSKSIEEFGVSNPQKLYSPMMVFWHLTNRCNLRCDYCYMDSGERETKEISLEAKLDLVDQFSEIGLPEINFTGGESILSPHFWDVLKKANHKKIYTGVFTNGTTITSEVINRLRESGLDEINISFETLKQSTNKRCKAGYVDFVLDAIKRSKESGIRTILMLTLTKSNLSELESLIKYGRELGVDEIDLIPFKPVGRGAQLNENLSIEDYMGIIQRGYKLFLEDRETFIPVIDAKFSRCVACSDKEPSNLFGKIFKTGSKYIGGCMAGTYYCSILPDGKVTPCPLLPDIIVGDTSEKPFKEIWQNSFVFERLRDRTNFKGKCGNCSDKEYCGGCRSSAYYLTGELFEEDPYCIVK